MRTRRGDAIVGMAVAQRQVAMRLSEAITLYLAAAAPFGVAFLFRRQAAAQLDARSLALAALAGLAWPLTILSLLTRKITRGGDVSSDDEGKTSTERKVERGVRVFSSALAEVEEAFEAVSGGKDERVSYAHFAARRAVERFAGLALAARGVSASAPPAPREMELCRVAGRTGEDLLQAGRCAHRRNALRLLLHRERARGEVLHALAEIGELAHEAARSATHPATHARAHAVRDLSDATLRAYGLALELLSDLKDERAASGVRRLIDAERARLHDPVGQPSDSRRRPSRREEEYVRHERHLQRL